MLKSISIARLFSRSLFCVVLVVALAGACGADDEGGDGDGDGDASAGDGDGDGDALGARCGTGVSCPGDQTCVIQPVPTGSATEGYCSPTCTGDTECTADYTGPGSPVCFSMNRCTIVCTTPGATSAECPTDLTCLETGGPTNVCAVPQ